MNGFQKLVSLGMALLLATATPGIALAKERGQKQGREHGWSHGQPNLQDWRSGNDRGSRDSKRHGAGKQASKHGDYRYKDGGYRSKHGDYRYKHGKYRNKHGDYRYGYAGRRGYPVHRHRSKHKHSHGTDVWPFVALGLGTAYILSRPSYPQAPAYQAPAYQSRAYQSEVINDAPRAQAVDNGPAGTCVMTREYQTEIAVGGELVPAYGTACLQPDGSWYRGPAVAERY